MRRIVCAFLFIPILGAASPAASAPDEKTAAVARGSAIFGLCAACHGKAAAGSPNPGPDLLGIFGRTAGSAPGFRYSRALRNAKLVWTKAALDEYLADPQAAVPGNTMPFPGLPDETQRRDLIAYLETLDQAFR